MNLKKGFLFSTIFFAISLLPTYFTIASGVGYVNFDMLVQSHPDFPAARVQLTEAIQKANEQWASQSQNFETEQERKNLDYQLSQNINQLQDKLLNPIEKDVVSKINKIRKAKGLDCIVAQGAIIVGSENATDQTDAVKALLTK